MDTQNTILMIDPHLARAYALRRALGDGYQYAVVHSLEAATTTLDETSPDVILVSEDSNEGSLTTWLRQVSAVTFAPIIVLASTELYPSRILAFLEAGAAYYEEWTDPLYLSAIVARLFVRAADMDAEWPVRPRGQEEIGGVVINYDRRDLTVAGRIVKLTIREWQIFSCIAKAKGRPIRASDIVNQVWGERTYSSYHPRIQTTRVYIGYIRRKIGSERIVTQGKFGYRMVTEAG